MVPKNGVRYREVSAIKHVRYREVSLYCVCVNVNTSLFVHLIIGCSYFCEFWNLVEIGIILMSALSVFFYFYRDRLARDLMAKMPDKVPNIFINFQFAANWDLGYTYIVALIVFFVMVKFIKLLRFNKRICLLSNTLKAAWYPLSMFSLILGK